MSKAAELAALIGSQSALSNRNLIINGAMQVAQRGTSATLTSGLVFCVDRFQHTANTGGAGTASQQAFTVGQTDVPNATYYLRHDQTTGASAAPSIRQYIEDVNTYQGKTVVLSYYAKVGSGTLTVTPLIQQNFGSGGSTAVSINPSPATHTITTSWQKFTCTFSLPSVSGKTIGTGSHLRVLLQFPTSTTFTFDVALVQLEVGEQATPFEHRSYGDELAKCQRYYERVSGVSSEQRTFATGKGTSSTNLRTIFYMKTVKRASPTISGTTVRCDVGADATSPSLWLTGLHNVGIDYTTSGLSTNNMYLIYNRSGSADYIDMDAEL